MGVAEEAEGRGQVAESLLGVEIAEDVIVLVEGRAVADDELAVDRLRSLGQAPEELGVGLGQGLLGPADGGRGDGVERLQGFGAAHGLVVVAPDDRQGFEGVDLADDLVGRGAVADQVAQADVVVDLFLGRELEQDFEGFQVAVDVAEDQVAHGDS